MSKKTEHMTEADLMALPKRELVRRCWTAEINADFTSQSASEAWARVAELTAVLEDDTRTEAVRLYVRLKAHQTHVKDCQAGSCEGEFNALVRAGLASSMTPKRRTP